MDLAGRDLAAHLGAMRCAAFLSSLWSASLRSGAALAVASRLIHYLRMSWLLEMLDRLTLLGILYRSLYLTCARMMLMHNRRILTCRQTRHSRRLSLLLAQY